MILTPAYPAFRSLPDYHFYDPLRAKDGYNEKLPDAATDAAGDATFNLGLQKYARATYRVHFLARAFEPDSGRSVAADNRDARVGAAVLGRLQGGRRYGTMCRAAVRAACRSSPSTPRRRRLPLPDSR